MEFRLRNKLHLTENSSLEQDIIFYAENIIIETIKPSYDGKNIVLRLYESERMLTNCTLSFDKKYSIFESDLLEENLKILEKNKSEITLQFTPFEIKTIILK